MLRTGDQYRNSLRDGREVWIDGKKVKDVPNHPIFKPIVDIRARIYDMAHEDKFRDKLIYTDEKTKESLYYQVNKMIDSLTDRDIRAVELMLEGLRKEIQDGIYD